MAMLHSLNVALGERSYPIYIGDGLLQQTELLQRHIPGRQVLLVSNESIAPLYLETVAAGLSGYDVATLVLPDGEVFKTLDILKRIYDVLLERRFDRGCTLLALGGGVVGDMTGFAAATYQRGVHYIQLPTTLLAQVDSSVGGKTAVNHPLGKNMIGAFHQPRCVIADIDTLRSLPVRELRAGLAEVIKYGLIADAAFFDWLEANMEALLACEPAALAYAIERSCHNKAAIVAADERESGARALLNLGHTFGHAIETGVGYGSWLHGEAVATGICMAADLSVRMGWLDAAAVERIVQLLARTGLPVQSPVELDNDAWLQLMAVDKKVRDGQLRLILLKAIGEGTIAEGVAPERLEATLNACRAAQA